VSGRLELKLFMAQRISAMILAPLVLAHLATMIVVIRGGLSAGEILSRTRGSGLLAFFYGLFVLAAAVHGSIGLRSVAREMTPWRGRSLDLAAVIFCLLVMAIGFRAVMGIS